MSQLRKLQQTFQHCVLHPDQAGATEWVSASGRAAVENQLSVYSHAYSARLHEVLADDYPALVTAMGDTAFEQLAQDYIQTHPSLYFSLRDFGRNLPGYIADRKHPQQLEQNQHWLYELALFEWTLGQAFDAADKNLLSEQDMASIPAEAWPELSFTMHPSVLRLDLEWNIAELWQALTAKPATPVTAVREIASPWLIWREQLVTRFRSLQSDEQQALDTLRKGGNFNDMCQVLTRLMSADEVPLRAASLLKGWIGQGVICGVRRG